MGGAAQVLADTADLRHELRLPRHLLEQPPPHADAHPARRRSGSLGEPASAVLVVTGAVRHRVDGREPLRQGAGVGVRHRAARRGARLLRIADGDHPQAGGQLHAGDGHRPRPEGQGVAGAVRRRHRPGVRESLARGRHVRHRRAHVADPRPSARAHDRSSGGPDLGEFPTVSGNACSIGWEPPGRTFVGVNLDASTKEAHMSAPSPVHRRLWITAGSLTIAYIVLTFAGVAFEYTLQLGQSRQDGVKQLVQTSLPRNYVGGYIEYVAPLVLFVGLLLVARLLRGTSETTGWLSSCMSGSVIANVAVTIAAGFAAGAPALYNAHHGASLSTATAVNDIRNFAFFLSGGLVGIFAVAAGVAGQATGLLPRWVSYAGIAIGTFSILAVMGARIGLQNVSTMLWFLWLLVFGVVALRSGGRTAAAVTPAARVPATV